jgi:uncharacterized membrane protein
MKNIVLYASIAFACGLLFVNIYTSLVDAKSWGSNIPTSISTARDYFKTVNPGDFFRKFSPFNQVLALLVLILFWKSVPAARLYFGIALIMYVLGDVMTFTFFYPRNAILFEKASLNDVELLTNTWKEWSSMNWVRSAIVVVGIIFSFFGLGKVGTFGR